MDLTAITSELQGILSRQRIVFWYDPEKEFLDVWSQLSPDGAKVMDLSRITPLEMKVRIELEDPQGRYLIYSAAEAPPFADDWLRDVRLYGHSFRADYASMVLRELGLPQSRLREHVRRRMKFFRSRKRRSDLKHLVSAKDTKANLDHKMLAVVVGSNQPGAPSIVRALLHAMATAPILEPAAWNDIEKFGLRDPFWSLVREHFEYDAEEPRLTDLAARMLISDFDASLKRNFPARLRRLKLPDAGARNAIVFLNQWKDSGSKGQSFNWWSDKVWSLYELEQTLDEFELDDLLEITTFSGVEQLIANHLRNRILEDIHANADEIDRIVDRRRHSHWVSSSTVAENVREARAAVYLALTAAARILEFWRTYKDGFDAVHPSSLYRKYETELFRIDQLYRRFSVNANVATAYYPDILKDLRERIEDCYRNWYLTEIALAWDKHVATCLPEKWECSTAPKQFRFYANNVAPWIRQRSKRRAFVIISDALRYEVAEELFQGISSQPHYNAQLLSQLGVLPSYTALGMASLLPHDELSYTEHGNVLVDGKPSSTLKQRSEILRARDGMAIKAEHLLSMPRNEARNAVAHAQVVYIYHNEIDATGDSASTEAQTFAAATRAIRTLRDLTTRLVNSLNANYVIITADHGFLFTTDARDVPDKSPIDERLAGIAVAKKKKRYLLGRNLPEYQLAYSGNTRVTAQTKGGMQFWIPKGWNLFHFVGGARFVHGGAMLQEIVVPIIQVRHTKRTSRQRKYVGVQVLNTRLRITTPRHRIHLLQLEPVTDRVLSVTLKVAIYEGDQPVTDIHTVTFSSPSDKLDERQQFVTLTLRDQSYSKKTQYRLVLQNVHTNILDEHEVVIDRAIIDEF
ncbi:MAG: BREX-1 system phosphatase PglZ type A [Bacteroidetes bacterium]|nr:BREX-1 system phosphatase PglZ type A [Bacteroidota bacterium]